MLIHTHMTLLRKSLPVMKNKYLISCFAVLFIFAASIIPAFGQLSITSTGTPFTIDFDSTVPGVNNEPFDGSGFAPTSLLSNGQLSSDAFSITGLSDGNLAFEGTATSGDFARGPSTGGVTTGGIYAFEVSTGNFTLGFQPSAADLIPGEFILRFQNNTGNDANSLLIEYLIWFNNDQNRTTSLNVSYSIDGSSFNAAPGLNFSTPTTADSDGWQSVSRLLSIDLSSSPLLDGDYYFIKWTTNDAATSLSSVRDELAIDNISVTINPPADADSRIVDFEEQPETTTVPSIADTEGEVIGVFNFVIEDLGTSDFLPTKVKTLRFIPGPNNNAQWSTQIQSALVWDGGDYYTPESVVIDDSFIDLNFAIDVLSISNGGELPLGLLIYLNQSGIIDGNDLQFQINSDATGFDAYSSGSGFSTTFPETLNSNILPISVQASELRFINQPINANTFEAMATDVSVEATDENGNRDLDFTDNISLSSSGTMAGDPISVAAVDGVATWLESTDPIVHTLGGTDLILTAGSGVLTGATSDPFDITQTADRLEFTSYPFFGQRNQIVEPIVVSALKPDLTVDENFTGNITLAVNSGPGGITGTVVKAAVNGVATFNNILFNTDGVYTLSASGPVYMTPVISGDIEIVPFFQGFFSCPAPGWLSVVISGNAWVCDTDYASINGLGASGPNQAWYVSPVIDFSALTNQVMSFDSWTSGIDVSHPRLEVLYSTNYSGTGNPNLATWNTLAYNIPAENSAVWTPSGIIDLSAITSTARIAFKYTSSGTTVGFATDWRLDNVAITENGCLAPTIQASNLLFQNIQTTEMTLSWQSGNGTGRIVLASTDPITDVPVSGTDYTANAAYGSGSDLGSSFVVYKGNENRVTITNLDPATVYYYAIYEYNCNADDPVINTTDPATGSQQTINPNASDIIVNGSFTYPENIAYGNYQATALSMTPTNSLAVFGLTLQDGGASGESDGFPTTLTSISFTANGSRAIRAAALFYGGVFIDSAYVNGSLNDFTFNISDTPIEAPDLGTANFELYVTFMSGSNVIDNDQIIFSVTAATADPVDGTLFSLPDAGGATSIATGGDGNTIRVEATVLKFVTVPSTTILINTPFVIEVEAVDSRGTRDREVILDLSKLSGSGSGNISSISGLQQNTSQGTAIWNDLIYNLEESNIILQVADNAAILASIQTNTLNAKSGLSVFSFTGAAGNEPEFAPDFQPANVNIGNITRGIDLEPRTLTDAFSSRNWTTEDTVENEYYYEFTITAEPGFSFSISSMELDHRRTNTGPNNWEIRTSADGYAEAVDQIFTTPAAGTWYTNEEIIFGSAVQNETSVTIRIYAYNASGDLGTFAIDNLAIFGTVQDVKAPLFTDTYPQYDSVAIAGFDLLINLDEAATVYYIIQDTSFAAPSAEQVIAGLDGTDAAAEAFGMLLVTDADSTFRRRINSLGLLPIYDVYFVLNDGTNQSDVIVLENVPLSDADTDLDLADVSQPVGTTISSIADISDAAVPVFSFNITDAGTADGAPTHITKLVFNAGAGNMADWGTTIGGISLYNDTDNSVIPISNTTITATSVEVDLDLGNLTVADGTSEQITLSVWLTQSVTDNEALVFEIGGAGYGNLTYFIGSQFNSTLATLTSNTFSIDVVADRLHFVDDYLTAIETSVEFSVTVLATDVNGNQDLDDNSTLVDLTRGLGTGALTTTSDPLNPPQETMVDGAIIWTDLLYDGVDEFFTLIASDNESLLLADTTTIIMVGTATDLIVTSGNTVTISTNQAYNKVTIEPMGVLNLNNGITLSIGDTLTIDGTYNNLGGTTLFNGTVAQSIESNESGKAVNFYNITISNTDEADGVVNNIHINLINTLKLNAATIFDADGSSDNRNFTLVSTPSATARIDKIEDGAELRGEIVWQRSLRTGPQGWRYIGTPIKNQTLANFRDDVFIQGIAESYPNAWTNIATYSEPLGTTGQNGLDGWVNFTSVANPILNGRGMKLWLWNVDYATEAKIINKGFPIIGDGTDGIAGSGEAYEFNISFEPTSMGGGGWNFFANPYPSEIDWDLVNKTDLSGQAVYIWNPNTQQYGTYSPIGAGTSIGGVTQYIASGQGFFIKANSGASTLSVSEDSKSTASGNSFLRKSGEPLAKMIVEIIASDGKKDETAIAFADFATNGYDPQYDALKLAGGWVNLSSKLDNGKLIAINAMGEKRGVQSVKLHIEPYVYGAYSMKFPLLESFNDQALIRLRDHYLNKTTFINKGSAYVFNIDKNNPATFGGDRFEIQFVEPAAFRFADKAARAGQEFVMPVYADQLADVMSAFMSLSWDREALTFLGIEDAGDASMSNFDLSGVENGKLVFSEESTTPMNLPDGSQLFSIRFMANNGMSQAQLRFEKAASRLRAIDNIDMPFTSKDVLISILQNRFVAGEIATFSGEFVHEASVMARSVDENIAQISGLDGTYKLNTFEQSSYTISASKTDSNPLKDVVTTLDIIRSRMHLLGKEKFTSPYQIIAADVNGSNSVTTLDLVEMQKVVLGINQTFTSGLNWLIIPESYDLTNNPFAYKTSVDVALTDQDMNLNFIGVKVGDVDNSWVNPDAARQAGGLLVLSLNKVTIQDEFIEIPVIVAESQEIRGYQFSITWDATALEYYNVESGDLEGFFNDNLVANGVLTTMWDEAGGNAVKLQAGQTLVTLPFRARAVCAARWR